MQRVQRIASLIAVAILGVGITSCSENTKEAPPASNSHAAPAVSIPACDRHNVPDCPFCSPEVLETMGFCRGHGVPEAVCTKCRDDLEAAFRAEGDWCNGHGLPESHCEACNPGTLDKYQSSNAKPVQSAQATPEVAVFKSDAPRSQAQPGVAVIKSDVPRSQAAPSLACTTDSSVVRFASNDVANRVGLQFDEAQRTKLRKTLDAPATVEYDSRAHARLAPRASGTVIEVRHDLGDRVEAGDVLVILDAAALGEAKSELLQASARVALWERNSERERGLLEKGLSTERESLEAETQLVECGIHLASAEQHLANLGLNAEQIAAVKANRDTSSLLSIAAPFRGVVVGLDAVLGESVSPATSVVDIADTSSMWVMLDVEQSEIRHVEIGQPVLLTADGWAGETQGGRVTWMSSEVDRRTRTVKVRAEFDNSEGILRAHGFGAAKIVTRDDDEAVLIPKTAVQWEGCCNVAFERISDTEFAPRKLRLGYETEDHYEVLQGLTGGETLVTQGSFILKTELRKGSIGAGCCEVDHLSE